MNYISRIGFCFMCHAIGNGKCKIRRRECECSSGFTGPTCSVLLDVTEIPKSDTTVPSNVNMSSYEMSSIAAGVLGGILFFFIIGLVIFIIWKIRKNRKKKLSAQSTSTSSNRYVITPPLYNISISRENSIPLPDPPITDHIYEELP